MHPLHLVTYHFPRVGIVAVDVCLKGLKHAKSIWKGEETNWLDIP